MTRWFGIFILATLCFCQSSDGMFGFLGFGNKEKKDDQKIVSLLENPATLPAGDKFKLFMQTVDAPRSCDFLWDTIEQEQEMMEKKFGLVIEGVGFFGLGKIFSLAARSFRLPGLMVDGLLSNRDDVTGIFRKVSGKVRQEKQVSIKEMLEHELKESIGRKRLAGAVGRFAAGLALQCIADNQKEIPEIIIKEMVVGKKNGSEALDEKEIFQQEQSNEKGGGVSHKALTWAVNLVLEKCVSEGPEWKDFFGYMAQKAYGEKKGKKSLQEKSLQMAE